MDTVVEVELQLPESATPISSSGIVVHRQVPAAGKIAGVGVQFVDASDLFRESIDRYMDTLLKE